MTRPSSPPIVGRDRELDLLADLRTSAARGEGSVLLLSGDGGVGKTRLVRELARLSKESGWQVMYGRAYALETAIAYAPFSDATEPVLSAMDGNLLLRLTRGDRSVLAALAPSLSSTPAGGSAAHADIRLGNGNAAEQHARLHAGIMQLFARLAERAPVLLILENLQWADSASIELFHFLARQLSPHRILLVGTWNETERELTDHLRTMVRSLRSLGVARDIRLEPLSPAALGLLISQRFDVELADITSFVHELHEATRGNPFFVEQILEELVASGQLRKSGQVWIGWHLEQVVLPRSVRDVLQARIERLSPAARRVAELVAVSGNATSHLALHRAFDERERASLDPDAKAITANAIAANVATADTESGGDARERLLLSALDELRSHSILVERLEHGVIAYDLAHPLLRLALIDDVGLARERGMHARIALALEAVHGDRAERFAEQIAAHWRLADPATETHIAVRWLLLAGRLAKARFAQREAAIALQAALDRADAYPALVDDAVVTQLLDELSRLYRRLGEYHLVIGMCERARDLADQRGDHIGVAVAERRLGLANEGLGRRTEAVHHFDNGIARAELAGDMMLVTRLRLAKGDSLQALGLNDVARKEIAMALDLADQRGDAALLARAHRMLLKLHTWSGPVHRAWVHARAGVELATQSGERNLAWSAHWSAAVLAGLTSNIAALQQHLAQATRLADELHSPLLQLRTAEISIEYHAGTGEWDRALVEGERAIAAARAIDQTTLLARLLYWVGGVYLQRGDIAEAQRLIDESWTVCGADSADIERPLEIHGILPAYAARVMWLGAIGEHARALELGRNAIALAERTGYVAWSVYRLMPAAAESALALDDREALAEIRTRLAHASATLSHSIGLAWVDIIDGELARRTGNSDAAIAAFHKAVSVLEGVPVPFDAAKARVRLARALQESGDIAESTREARAALQMFESLGARPAMEEARALLRALGARLPTKRTAPGFDGLTGRELEIVRLVAKRQSNKEIGAQLDISSRTVGTRLANVFDKVGIRDRTALGDLAREQGLHRE